MTQDPFQYSSKTCCKHANNCFEKIDWMSV